MCQLPSQRLHWLPLFLLGLHGKREATALWTRSSAGPRGAILPSLCTNHIHKNHVVTTTLLYRAAGLVGVTCGALGAHVTCTDLPAVLNSTQSIIGKNLATVADAGGSINVRALDWYTPNDDILNGPWDMIIGEAGAGWEGGREVGRESVSGRAGAPRCPRVTV